MRRSLLLTPCTIASCGDDVTRVSRRLARANNETRSVAQVVRRIAPLMLLSFVFACGGGGSSTAPTPSIPNVVGNYTGTVTINFPEIPSQLTCPSTTAVTQSGSTVSIAPIVLGGSCGNLSLPFGQATIDATGNIPGETGSFFDNSCGGTYNYSASGGFFGRDFRFSMSASSSKCLNFNVTGTLTR